MSSRFSPRRALRKALLVNEAKLLPHPKKKKKEVEVKSLNQGDLKQIEYAANTLLAYCKCARGEIEDTTGFGLWTIALSNLEQGANVRVITLEQWKYFTIAMKKLSEYEKGLRK